MFGYFNCFSKNQNYPVLNDELTDPDGKLYFDYIEYPHDVGEHYGTYTYTFSVLGFDYVLIPDSNNDFWGYHVISAKSMNDGFITILPYSEYRNGNGLTAEQIEYVFSLFEDKIRSLFARSVSEPLLNPIISEHTNFINHGAYYSCISGAVSHTTVSHNFRDLTFHSYIGEHIDDYGRIRDFSIYAEITNDVHYGYPESNNCEGLNATL